MRARWKRVKWRREQQSFEHWLFNYAPVAKWVRDRDINKMAGVWKWWHYGR